MQRFSNVLGNLDFIVLSQSGDEKTGSHGRVSFPDFLYERRDCFEGVFLLTGAQEPPFFPQTFDRRETGYQLMRLPLSSGISNV
jgi:hypothetical protein